MSQPNLILGHLYPSLMNVYGDRGNIRCLERRCAARGISLEVMPLEIGDTVAPDQFDILFMGGAQDHEQRLVASDLAEHKSGPLREAVERGVVFLGVCGGFQLAGRSIVAERESSSLEQEFSIFIRFIPGASSKRLIGNLAAEWEGGTLVGFENHGGRTYLGPRAEPLARVVRGFGNDGVSGFEGARYKNAFGCYLHGPVLPKNPALADRIIALAMENRYGEAILGPLDDAIELRAHDEALHRR